MRENSRERELNDRTTKIHKEEQSLRKLISES